MPTAWLQVSIRAAPEAHDAIANHLIERGSPGVVLKKRSVQAYFAVGQNRVRFIGQLKRFLDRLKAIYPALNDGDLRWRVVRDRNWNRAWQRFFKPQWIGRRFVVCPPWDVPEALDGRHLITIEPGLAFGTGTHASTRACLEFLEETAASFDAGSFDALDVGTGSGILAIALVKLGARKVWAIDNDPVALTVARANLAANHAAGSVRLSGASLSRLRRVFPLVVANLTAPTILEHADHLAAKVERRGFLILGGILTGQAASVSKAFAERKFKVLRRKRENEWVALLLRRR